MAIKICPQCNTKHGVRKLKCECGFDFKCKRPSSLYPEPGTWAVSKTPGIADIEPPEPLSHELISANQVKDIISYEGLGFTLYSYLPAEQIADPKLKKLWQKARTAMQSIVEYLERC
jgi:hypothetical protein